MAFVAATLSLCISEMASLWSAGWSAVLYVELIKVFSGFTKSTFSSEGKLQIFVL